MTSEIIEKDIRETIPELMRKEGIEEYDVHIDGQSESGDNYSGEIVFFRIVPKDLLQHHVYDLVFKTAKRSEELRKACPVEMVYNREIFLYNQVFPAYKKFLEEKQANFDLDFVPKCYHIKKEVMRETLIFENLKSRGFQLWNRKKPWNLEHSLMVMEHYGRFHGISMAFKDQRCQIYNSWTEHLQSFDEEFSKCMDLKRFYEEPIKNVLLVLQKYEGKSIAEKYADFYEQMTAPSKNRTPEEDRVVLIHGDCWNNNFMFQYEDIENTSKPTRTCFLDFQLSVLETPVRDLSYNIYTTCDKTCLDQFDKLMTAYYKSLSQTLKDLGSDPDKLFPHKKLIEHWKKYGKIGLLFAITGIRIGLVDKNEAPDLAKLSEEGKSIEEAFQFDVDEDNYNKRIVDVFTHYANTFM